MKIQTRSFTLYILLTLIITVSCSFFSKKDIAFLPEGAKIIEMDKSKIELDDGDSFTYDGMGIRVLGMDTPEIAHPEHGFHSDQPFGRQAAKMTAGILVNAKSVSYVPYERDRYGRMLAHVFVDGNLLSVKLIRAGLAHETVSHYGDNGFPKLAERIKEAAENSEAKDFMPPYKWRQQNRGLRKMGNTEKALPQD